MSRIEMILAGAALALLCGGCARSHTLPDGAAFDAGVPNVGMDAGRPRDSGRVDAGRIDAFVLPGCSVSNAGGFSALPTACLPRCASSTASCLGGCADEACEEACLAADPVGPITLSGDGMSTQLDCRDCVVWQSFSCLFDSCGAELTACQTCPAGCNPDPNVAGCETEEAAVVNCLTTNDSTIASCSATRVSQCFGP